MPYTAKQRRYFHAQAAKGKPGMKELAAEADEYARKGKEKKVAKKVLPAKIAKKPEGGSARTPMPPAKKAAAKAVAKKAVAKKVAAYKKMGGK